MQKCKHRCMGALFQDQGRHCMSQRCGQEKTDRPGLDRDVIAAGAVQPAAAVPVSEIESIGFFIFKVIHLLDPEGHEGQEGGIQRFFSAPIADDRRSHFSDLFFVQSANFFAVGPGAQLERSLPRDMKAPGPERPVHGSQRMPGGAHSRGGDQIGRLAEEFGPMADEGHPVDPIFHDAVHVLDVNGAGQDQAIGRGHLFPDGRQTVLTGTFSFTLIKTSAAAPAHHQVFIGQVHYFSGHFFRTGGSGQGFLQKHGDTGSVSLLPETAG